MQSFYSGSNVQGELQAMQVTSIHQAFTGDPGETSPAIVPVRAIML
jgi:hypothetical protein